MSEAAPDATPTEILVKQKDKPDYICNKICYLLQKKAYVRLSGLEGAIVVAVDAATLLQETRAVSVVSIETSFPEIQSRATGILKRRSKIEILLKCDSDIVCPTILYGAEQGDTYESQYLLHNTFCSQYSVSCDYSSINRLGNIPLGSLALLCFPTQESMVTVSGSAVVPEGIFKNILSFLPPADQLSACVVMKARTANGGDGDKSDNSRRHHHEYIIDPFQLRSNILAPKEPEEQVVKYVNIEVSDEENQCPVGDAIIEEPIYFELDRITSRTKIASIIIIVVLICVIATISIIK